MAALKRALQGTVYVSFGEGRSPSDRKEAHDGSAVITETRGVARSGRAVLRLEDYDSSLRPESALRLLRDLNLLADEDGHRYSGQVRYHGYEPWWFHQHTVYHQYLLPYTRYRRLLERLIQADRVVLLGGPPDFTRLARLMLGDRVEIRDPSPRPSRRQAFNAALARGVRGAGHVAALRRSRSSHPRALVYTIDVLGEGADCDPRIERLYDLLSAHQVSFVEIAWSVDARRAVRNWWRRRRSVLYVQACAPPASALPPTPPQGPMPATASVDDRLLLALAERVCLPAAHHSIGLIERLEALVRRLGVREAWLIDDSRHAYELVVACKRVGVPTTGVQHGQFNAYTVGLMAYGFAGAARHAFDRYWIWSPFFRDLLLQHSDLFRESDLVIGGPSQALDRGPVPERARQRSTSRTRVLWLAEQYESAVQDHDVAPYLAHLATRTDFDVTLKLHPSWTEPPPGLLSTAPSGRFDIVTGRLGAVIREADVVVASYSSAVFEAILAGRPVVLFATSQYRDPHGLAAAGLAELAATPEQLADCIRRIPAVSHDELLQRRHHVWGDGAVDPSRLVRA